MENNKKLEYLMYAYDAKVLGIKRNLDYSILKTAMIGSSVPKIPTWAERITVAAWDICFLAYLQDNPSGSIQDFKSKFISTIPGIKAYQKALDEVSERLSENVDVAKLLEFKNSLA